MEPADAIRISKTPQFEEAYRLLEPKLFEAFDGESWQKHLGHVRDMIERFGILDQYRAPLVFAERISDLEQNQDAVEADLGYYPSSHQWPENVIGEVRELRANVAALEADNARLREVVDFALDGERNAVKEAERWISQHVGRLPESYREALSISLRNWRKRLRNMSAALKGGRDGE